MRTTRTPLGRAASIATQLVIFNFIAFLIVSVCIGGDAINGKIVNGHYFLDQNGRYTAVSHAVWTYSRAHTISVLVSVAALLVFAAVRSFGKIQIPAA